MTPPSKNSPAQSDGTTHPDGSVYPDGPAHSDSANPGEPAQPSWKSSKVRPPRTAPPNYFARREQLRLFVLCSMLMLVLVMMNEARKPSTWDWLWAGKSQETIEAATEPIDTKLEKADPDLPADGFTSNAVPTTESVERRDNYLPEISAELLRPIKDNTVMRAAENDAWLALFTALQSRSAAEIESLSTGKVGFAQLFRQTDLYRGRLVTVQGTARRIEPIIPRPNDVGITQLYRWVLQLDGSNSPVIVYSLEKPALLEAGADLRERCAFTGFCFKRWAYVAGDGTRVAPLLLARTPQWSPSEEPAPTVLPALGTLALATLALAGISAVIALVVYRTANVRRPDIDRLRVSHGDLNDVLTGEPILPNARDALGAREDHDRERSP